MKLTQDNLDEHAWLFHDFGDGHGVMVREHENPDSPGGWDVEADSYTHHGGGWEPDNEFFAAADDVDALFKEYAEFTRMDFVKGDDVDML